MNKPREVQRTMSDVEVKGLPEGYFHVLLISSNGKDVAIDIPEYIIPFLNREILERSLFCVEDAFYKLRPDLRKQ